MDINKQELEALQTAAKESDGKEELKGLELALIGGGCGDISLG